MEERQNFTLSLPKTLLRKIKVLAAKRETSVSSLLTNLLADAVRQDDSYEESMRRLLARARKGFDLGTQGRITWTRDEVHERRS